MAMTENADGSSPLTGGLVYDDATSFMLRVAAVLADAERAGLVITVERRPLKPLAMGNCETVIDVRPARTLADETRKKLWEQEADTRRSEKETWWAGARAGLGLQQDAPRQEARDMLAKRRAEQQAVRNSEIRFYTNGRDVLKELGFGHPQPQVDMSGLGAGPSIETGDR